MTSESSLATAESELATAKAMVRIAEEKVAREKERLASECADDGSDGSFTGTSFTTKKFGFKAFSFGSMKKNKQDVCEPSRRGIPFRALTSEPSMVQKHTGGNGQFRPVRVLDDHPMMKQKNRRGSFKDLNAIAGPNSLTDDRQRRASFDELHAPIEGEPLKPVRASVRLRPLSPEQQAAKVREMKRRMSEAKGEASAEEGACVVQ